MNLKKTQSKKTIAFGVGMPRTNNKSKKVLTVHSSHLGASVVLGGLVILLTCYRILTGSATVDRI